MRVHLGSDHAGFELKEHLAALAGATRLRAWSTTARRSMTPRTTTRRSACGRRGRGGRRRQPRHRDRWLGQRRADRREQGRRGPRRARLVPETAELARLHNDANVVSIGARMHTVDEATGFVETFLTTEFTGEARHRRRIAMLATYEQTGQVPAADA